MGGVNSAAKATNVAQTEEVYDPRQATRGVDFLRINKQMDKFEAAIEDSKSTFGQKTGAYAGRTFLAIPSVLYNGIVSIFLGIFSCNETARHNFKLNGKRFLHGLKELPIINFGTRIVEYATKPKHPSYQAI